MTQSDIDHTTTTHNQDATECPPTDVLLAIVGSTIFDRDLAATIEAFDLICVTIQRLQPSLIISGGAKGIDTLAEDAARVLGVPTRIHLPAHQRWKPEGFAARNLLIAEDCTHMLCIRHHASTTFGSGWTAGVAEKLGKHVERHTI